MNPVSMCLLAGLVLQAVFILFCIFRAFQERSAAEAFAREATDPSAAETASKRFSPGLRLIAQDLASEVDKESTLDEALVRSIVRTTNEHLSANLWAHVGLHTIMIGSAFAPFAVAAYAGANQFAALAARHATGSAGAYVSAGPEVAQALAQVREGTLATAWLVANLALVWAFVWWMRRPEIREARFVRSLLEGAPRMRPNAKAPISGRLATLVAPTTDLKQPGIATGLWFVGVGAAWLMLVATAPAKASFKEPNFRVISQTESVRLTPPAMFELAEGRGGTPLSVDTGVTLSLGQDTIFMADRPVARYGDEGAWTWMQAKLQVEGRMVLMMVDHRLDMASTFDVMRRAQESKPSGFAFVAVRTTEGGRPVNVVYPVEVASDAADAPKIDIRPEGVLLGAKPVAFDDPKFRALLREHVGPDATRVALAIDTDTSFKGVLHVLSAADDPCIGANDCGLPGLGLSFTMSPR